MSADDGPRPSDREADHDAEGPGPAGLADRAADHDAEGPDPAGLADRAADQDTERSDPAGPLDRVAGNEGLRLVVRETALSVGAVVAIGLLLFAISGVWPPMVAVESGSMEPHMQKGDLVFITDTSRFAPDAAHEGTGVVTRETGREVGYWKFGAHGSVIVYDEPADAGPPVIHRAQFWVEEGENWYDRANPDYVTGSDCGEVPNCPAPNAGFVTKGDHNGAYDQVNGISKPVKPEWIVGVARVRIPYLGWVRLGVSGTVLGTTTHTATGPTAAAVTVDTPTVGGPPGVDRTTPRRVSTPSPAAQAPTP
ncbi:S26 family signal peptidase [Haloplanus rallus]|uniref:S26 family signal peptidase n=1 Tax=Haloplanus rallus TaxID=1816183 RepID=A0A6B9F506_9EURY|nr:S26 family signal peptidase [Haloplanus rallus]QGX95556.1 S26 family signal peptidase [Haloplanus rallus]